ncbi:uncharacterized protein N7483_001354 [Penicillium malachiteum]|uniref:uncharacterized protein n=1 Tax=Penicillium malachiteum TaxID=1324776 RepID=UPI002548256B|nr:uncharacterized protein N7483_001354 [Penicillium malachiteum]KAJ5736229.1 hypothetical protein N7483_001354 [Penicillium malachiteum]
MTTPTLVDPTKQAEYPIVLGERLSNADHSRLININYNYKTKHATSRQRSNVTRSARSHDLYDLSVTDKAPSADQTLTYAYQGSEDPDSERSLVLIFDPDRKVFVLEPLNTKLNFNLRSAPGKTEKQVIEQYEQLRITQEDEHTSGDDPNAGSTSEDEGPADDSNPYDFRHFLRKEGAEVKPASGNSTPEPVYTSKANTPVIAATKPAAKPIPRPKKQANPLREPKRPAKPQAKPHPPKPEPEPVTESASTRADPQENEDARSSISDAGTGSASQQTVQSPGSNIIVDGDLIIDMGSPPPSRAFKVNPAFFSSNNTPDERDDDGDEDMESFRLPSPARNTQPPPSAPVEASVDGDDLEDEDDLLAAEMEAAFEESAREEEARSQQYNPHNSGRYNVPSDDESEVSEEE